jgi:hypothetical protein
MVPPYSHLLNTCNVKTTDQHPGDFRDVNRESPLGFGGVVVGSGCCKILAMYHMP